MYLVLYIFSTFAIILTFKLSNQSFAQSDLTVTVGSYNIKNELHSAELIEDFNNIKHLDVLALQEVSLKSVSDSVFIHPLLNKLENIWKYRCVKPANLSSGDLWEAQAILSKYPIQECGVIKLNRTDDKERVAVWAKINLNGKNPFLFINTDHETDRYATLGFPDRIKQLKSLIEQLSNCQEWLADNCNDWPTVLTGDFNTNEFSLFSYLETSDEIKKTIDYLKTIDLHQIPYCSGHKATFTSYWGEYELDHIFVKNIIYDCRYTLKERMGSDHLPIWGSIQIR